MTDKEEIESMQRTLLYVGAKCIALESLCMALVECSPHVATIVEKFQQRAEEFSVTALNSDWLADAPVFAFQDEHARLLRVLMAQVYAANSQAS